MRGAVLGAACAILPALASAGPVSSWTLGFDLLTPPGMTCAADAPGGTVRASRSILLGSPVVTVHGDLEAASITCTAPDGSRWRTALPRDSRAPLSVDVEARAAWRPGAARLPLYITGEDRFTTPQVHRFTRLD